MNVCDHRGFRWLCAPLSCLSFFEPAVAQVRPSDLTGWTVQENAVTLEASDVRYRIRFVNDRTARVDLLPFALSEPESSLVVSHASASPVSTLENDSSITLDGGSLTVRVHKHPLRLSFEGPMPGSVMRETQDISASVLGHLRSISFALDPGVRIYGSGPRSTHLDLRGSAFDLWNSQVFGYSTPVATMNANVPIFLFSTDLAVFVDHWYRGRADFGVGRPDAWGYEIDGGELSYYVMAGTSYQDLIDLYTQLTGRPSLPPRWTLGYLQSKYGYQSATEALTTASTLRALGIPADGLILDLYWFSRMGDLTWNASAFPNPSALIAELRTMGLKTIVITEPYVTEHSGLFAEGQSLGHFAKNAVGTSRLIPNWWSCNCNAALVDLTSPAARSWWWSKHPSFLDAGVAALWTDLGEPETHPADMMHHLGDASRIHNLYNMLWSRTIAEGWAAYRPNERLFNLTRSGWAGSQRYGTALWSGDVSKSFGGLSAQRAMMLNAGLSGLGWFHSDIGGFCCGTSPAELYIRWMQFGAFAPIMRAHGTGGPTEPWGFGDEALAIARDLIRLRYQFIPYWYTLAHEQSVTGMPPVRPLFLLDPEDVALSNEMRAWSVGQNLIVAPVTQDGARSVTFRLPGGTWVDWWTGERISGGREVTVEAPLGRIPLFVRSGSIVPLGPVMQWSDERPLDTLVFVLHPDAGRSASLAVYEDDGISLQYRLGAFNHTSIEQTWTVFNSQPAMVFQLTSAGGSYAGQPGVRAVILDVRLLQDAPLSINVNGRIIHPYASWGDVLQAGEGGTYDAERGRLVVLFRAAVDSAYQVIMNDARVTSIGGSSAVPRGVELAQNYPNPFNGETVVRYRIEERGDVEVTVADLLGRTVATLVRRVVEAGSHQVTWNAGALPSGIYYCRLEAGGKRLVRKMVLVR
jgi:alpha-glucosidase (family GH31 glycosyl hydrolase)